MVRFLVGFLGRSTTWNLIKGLIFPEHVGLIYLSTYDDCSTVNFTIVEEYMADLVKGCGEVHVLKQPTRINIINAILKGLKVKEVKLGIDLGASRCGLTILINDIPILHTVTTWRELTRLVKNLSKHYSITIILGSSPGITNLVNDFINIINPRITIRFIDEEEASRRRPWFRDRYPYLSQDELDSLVYALVSTQWANAT